jgi:hypothetical protein
VYVRKPCDFEVIRYAFGLSAGDDLNLRVFPRLFQQ